MKRILISLLLCLSLMFTVSCNKKDDDNEGGENVAVVTYEVIGEGSILGQAEQTVKNGSDTSSVTAVADEGWIFIGWDDGYSNPTRSDKAVTEDVTFTAIFEIDDGGSDDSDFKDEADDVPVKPETDPENQG
ncbi:MAG: hypothetical protein E7673_04195 [Ruminococcaceae bacterium]|nr:hypothetical protein [Oscillospiraceae bacterium]